MAHRGTKLRELSDTIYQKNKSAPGQGRAIGVPSLNQLDPTIRRRVHQYRQRDQPFPPDVFAALVSGARLEPSETQIYLEEYIEAFTERDFESCLTAITAVLTQYADESSGAITVVRGRATIELEFFGIASPTYRAELREAQQMMATSADFGWITIVPSLEITAPSVPLCRLLCVVPEKFAGSYLIGDPLLSLLEGMLSNYGEWLLIISMMVNALRSQWNEHDHAEELERARGFFGRVHDYVRRNYEQVDDQISRAPDRIADTEGRQILDACLFAALGKGPWPSFSHNRWNSMRMYIGGRKYDLLPPNKIARFRKKGMPIGPASNPAGFEVTWSAEFSDDTANRLMSSILRSLGYP